MQKIIQEHNEMAALALSNVPPSKQESNFKMASPGWEWSESDKELEDVVPAPPTITRTVC